jgi:Secretion system C-terminal sorting domain/Ig-like domain CHU_C associated/Lysyl oxidase
MFKITTILLFLPLFVAAQATCTLEDASGCSCPTETANCDLLPDFTIAKNMILGSGGVVEYSQTATSPNTGRLRVTVATPNAGFGPLTVIAQDRFRCGDQPYTGSVTGRCPDGSTPKRLNSQRIYRKEGARMTYYDRPAGFMEYHPTHGHMHTNDWEHMTLRIKQNNEPNPAKWPIVGTTSKVGFCFQDYIACTGEPGKICTKPNGDTLKVSNLKNFGLGGGKYNCSPDEQGISVGYNDVYPYYLEGQDIRIPPETCNGAYQVVVQVDPLKQYLDADTTNNVLAVPVFLTQQRSGFHPHGKMSFSQSPKHLCEGDMLTVSGSAASDYVWTNGATSRSVQISQNTNLGLRITAPCGTDNLAPISLNFVQQSSLPTLNPVNQACLNGNRKVTLSGSGSGTLYWYDAPTGGNLIGIGNQIESPVVNQNTIFYAAVPAFTQALSYKIGKTDKNVSGGGFTDDNTNYQLFDVFQPFVIKTVKVYAETAGTRIIELRDGSGAVLQSKTVILPAGESRVTLNFNVPLGNDLQLGLGHHSLAKLHRDAGTFAYPYKIQDVAQINAASSGLGFYYYFYDWDIEEIPATCSQRRVGILVETTRNCVSTDAENPAETALQIHPNPHQGIFKIEGITEAVNIKVLDILGREVHRQAMERGEAISASHLSKGVYFVQIYKGEVLEKVLKTVIE